MRFFWTSGQLSTVMVWTLLVLHSDLLKCTCPFQLPFPSFSALSPLTASTWGPSPSYCPSDMSCFHKSTKRKGTWEVISYHILPISNQAALCQWLTAVSIWRPTSLDFVQVKSEEQHSPGFPCGPRLKLLSSRLAWNCMAYLLLP